jgi:hypothetical protein
MHRSMPSRVIALALLVGGLLLSPAVPVGAAAAVSVTATDDPAVVVVLATGFRDDEEVSTWLTGPSQQVQAGNYRGTNGSGDVRFRLAIPRHFEPGRWAITVHGLDSDREAVGYFEAQALGPDEALAVDPAGGPAGTTFRFSGDGFEAGELVSYWTTGPDGATHDGGVVDAGSGGVVRFNYTVGAEAQPGTWTMSAYGQFSDRLAVAAFIVE